MAKQFRIALILGVAMAMSVLISACGSTTTGSGSTPTAVVSVPGKLTCVQGSMTADGSTALAPLVQAVAKDYQSKCSGSTITVNLGGSKTGLSDAEAGAVQIGNSDVFASSTQSDLKDHQVAVVIFTLLINSKVTGVTGLTTAQIKSIYSGSITNWKQVGGPDLKIVVVSRPASSGTRATFQKYILGGPESISGPSSLTSDSTGTVVQNISQTDGAIGYAALGAAKASGLTMLTIDGSAPTPSLSESNTYKFWNIEHMYTKGTPSGLAQALIDYMSSDAAKTLANGLSFVSISDMQQSALQAHQPAS
ncbi:MAG: phosphate ABC transporter substrate-binding protein [Ktedonobacteraceae bacterium]